MKKKAQLLSTLMAASMMAGALSGCGSTAADNTANTEVTAEAVAKADTAADTANTDTANTDTASGDVTELKYWYCWTGATQENNMELAEAFNETIGKEKGIHVTAEYLSLIHI